MRESSSRIRILVAFGAAVALCGPAAYARNGSGGNGRASQKSAVSLTGCLQRSRSNGYLLTEENEPKAGGAPAVLQNKVARERWNEAEHAYTLNGDSDRLEKLVGDRVQVRGTLARRSDVTPEEVSPRSDEHLTPHDLARIDVTSVKRLARSCGTGSSSRR
jgi:hypothetical protein